jgi:hypothetical protein
MSKVIGNSWNQEAIERVLDALQHLPVKQIVIGALGFREVIREKSCI